MIINGFPLAISIAHFHIHVHTACIINLVPLKAFVLQHSQRFEGHRGMPMQVSRVQIKQTGLSGNPSHRNLCCHVRGGLSTDKLLSFRRLGLSMWAQTLIW